MKLIAANLNDHEAKTLTDIKAAMARNDQSASNLLSLLKEKASTFNDSTWEVMLTIAKRAAELLADKTKEQFGDDLAIEDDVIKPLSAFVQSVTNQPEAWFSHSVEGYLITAEMSAALLKVVRLLQENTHLRLDLLKKVNGGVEKYIMSDGVKVVIDSKTSVYTKHPLKPMSKRDLSAQIIRVIFFLSDNTDGFTIH